MNTPWGHSIKQTRVDAGFFIVKTRHGGGYVLAQSYARRLSDAARRRALRYGKYFCFDDETCWAIAAFELEQKWDTILAQAHKYHHDLRAFLHEFLSLWHPDYLVERGIEPEPHAYARWKARRDDYKKKIMGTDLVENRPEFLMPPRREDRRIRRKGKNR